MHTPFENATTDGACCECMCRRKIITWGGSHDESQKLQQMRDQIQSRVSDKLKLLQQKLTEFVAIQRLVQRNKQAISSSPSLSSNSLAMIMQRHHHERYLRLPFLLISIQGAHACVRVSRSTDGSTVSIEATSQYDMVTYDQILYWYFLTRRNFSRLVPTPNLTHHIASRHRRYRARLGTSGSGYLYNTHRKKKNREREREQTNKQKKDGRRTSRTYNKRTDERMLLLLQVLVASSSCFECVL